MDYSRKARESRNVVGESRGTYSPLVDEIGTLLAHQARAEFGRDVNRVKNLFRKTYTLEEASREIAGHLDGSKMPSEQEREERLAQRKSDFDFNMKHFNNLALVVGGAKIFGKELVREIKDAARGKGARDYGPDGKYPPIPLTQKDADKLNDQALLARDPTYTPQVKKRNDGKRAESGGGTLAAVGVGAVVGVTAGTAIAGAGYVTARAASGVLQRRQQPSQTRAPKAKAAAKAVGKAAGKTAKATHKAAKVTGKVATMAVLPAAHVVADAVKHRAHIAGAVKAAAAGDRSALAAMAKKAPLPLSTLILPAIAGVAAISTARDALRRGKSTTEAVGEGGYKASDVVLGGAISAYAEHREAGRTKMESIARATLTGIDNRLLFGLGQHLVNLQRAAVNEQQRRGDYEMRQASLEAEQGAIGGGVNGGGDQTTLAIARAFGPKDVGTQPAAGSAQALPGGGGRLTADQRRDFDARGEATQQPAEARSAKPPAAEDAPGGRKPGWGPEARVAAYLARNPGGQNIPYGGDPRNAEDYAEPKKSKGEMR